MKHKNNPYLAHRVLALCITLFGICLLLLLFWGLCRVELGRAPWPPLAMALLLAALAGLGYRFCYQPYARAEKLLLLFATGYTVQGLHELPCGYSAGMEGAVEQTLKVLSTDKLLSASKRQAQYLALQNQINPHFLYNTLEGIRSEALIAGLDGVADMTESLATFFRYTISKVENLVSVEDELRNTQTYFRIQRYRFGERLRLLVECDEED